MEALKGFHLSYNNVIFTTRLDYVPISYAAAIASISTSTSLGSLAAWMQVRAGLGLGSSCGIHSNQEGSLLRLRTKAHTFS